MHWIWLIIVGAIVGALGRLFHPGRDPMGFILTTLIGIASLADRGLVDVTGEDQVGAGAHERREHVVAACDGLLPRTPGGADQVVVEDGDPEDAVRRRREPLGDGLQLRVPDPAGLLPPRP